MNSFWYFIHDRVENLPHEIIEKQNMIIIVHIALKGLEEKLDKSQLTSTHDVNERKLFNSTQKRKLSKEQLNEKNT